VFLCGGSVHRIVNLSIERLSIIRSALLPAAYLRPYFRRPAALKFLNQFLLLFLMRRSRNLLLLLPLMPPMLTNPLKYRSAVLHPQ
jgi:hypothetical protein